MLQDRIITFTKKLDDKIIGREHELTIHFVTPFNENVDNVNNLQANSLGRPELMIVCLPDAQACIRICCTTREQKNISG